MSQLTSAEAAITRFKENENRVDIFVNQNGTYQTNEETPRQVETLPSFMQRMIDRYITLHFKGDWATSTAYVSHDLVKENGTVYIVLADHTSDVFADDLASNKLAIYQGITTAELSQPNGADFIGVSPVEEFSAAQTLQAWLRNEVWLPSFEGADPTGTFDSSDAIIAATAYAHLHKKRLRLGGGTYKMSKSWIIPEGLYIEGEGAGDWLAWTYLFEKKNAPTQIIFTGTGLKDYQLPFVTDNRTSGGRIANPSSLDSKDGYYSLTSFVNEDGSLKNFSCAVKTQRSGRGIVLKNFRIVLNNNGISGYNDNVSSALGDDWDVGFWNESGQGLSCESLHVVGHWRMYGGIQTCVIDNVDLNSANGLTGSEYSRYRNCNFQGAVGFGIRGGDTYKVVGVGTGYVEIEDCPTLPFKTLTSGKIKIGSSESSSVNFTYSSVSVVSGNLRFAVSENTTGVSVGNVLIANIYGFGISNSVMIDSEISGFNHPTSKRATQIGLSKPSAGLEISGSFVRGFNFRGSKIMGIEDVLIHLHNCSDITFDGQSIVEVKPDSISGTTGGRIICSPTPSLNTRVANPMGRTDRLRIEYGASITNVNTDFRPYSGLSAPNRFAGAGDVGFFNPHSVRWTDKQHPLDRANSILQAPNDGSVILKDAAGVNRVVVQSDVNLRDASGTSRVTVNAAGTVTTLNGGGTSVVVLTSAFRATDDNVTNLGSLANRWNTVYAGTGSINTSDEREKEIRNEGIEEAVLRAWSKVEYAQFKFKDAIEKKNNDARWHFGVIAQRVKEAFESEGLDAFKYGILCYDEWECQEEITETWEAEYDDNGNITKEGGSKILIPFKPAGNRYGIRYEEALALECAYLRSRLQN